MKLEGSKDGINRLRELGLGNSKQKEIPEQDISKVE